MLRRSSSTCRRTGGSPRTRGIIVADAITWHGADAHLAAQGDVPPAAVARGLLFRVLTSSEQYRDHADDVVLELEAERYNGAARTFGW